MADHKCEICGKPATWRVVDKQEVVADGATATVHFQHLSPHYFCDEHKREERVVRLDPAPTMDLNREPGAAASPELLDKWRAAKAAAAKPVPAPAVPVAAAVAPAPEASTETTPPAPAAADAPDETKRPEAPEPEKS